jgi:ATP-dependent Clp protease adaptor protein ClpS
MTRFGRRIGVRPNRRGTMGGMALPQVAPVETPNIEEVPADERPWVTIVWDDPVNLMSYVTWVFQKLFGYSHDKAEQLMMDVHNKGKAVVSIGARERMEMDASQLHGYGLWATVDRA